MSNHKPEPGVISVRRSYQLSTPAALVVGVGLWVILGFFGLVDPLLTKGGRNAPWAYGVLLLLMLPSLLSHLELRSWIGLAGGSYRLVRALERNTTSFAAGWTYLLGWAGLSALLAYTIASSLHQLASQIIPPLISVPLLTVALLVVFALANMVRVRPRWRVAVWTIVIMFALLAVIVVLVLGKGGGAPPRTPPQGTSLMTWTVLLCGAMWVAELEAELGARNKSALSVSSFFWFGGPLLTLAFHLIMRWRMPGITTFADLVQAVLPVYGSAAAYALTALVGAIAMQALSLLMVHRLQIIGRDGWVPENYLASYTHFRTPVVMLSSNALLAALIVAAATQVGQVFNINTTPPTMLLAGMAAFPYLVLQIMVNVTAILMARHPRAAARSVHLPIYPVIPAVGAALCFLLILALPGLAVLGGVFWAGIGAILYWRSAREGMRETHIGLTVFQDTSRFPDITSAYPVVVAVANPDTAAKLAAFGALVARSHEGHLMLVQVIDVPSQLPLESARGEAQGRHALLERVIGEIRAQYGVNAEGVTRLSRSVPQGILDTVREEQARLVVMGWPAHQQDPSRGRVGHILDEVIENAPCDVVIARGDWDSAPRNVLVPVGGGPNAPCAADLAVALTPSDGEVLLINIARTLNGQEAVQDGHILLGDIRSGMSDPAKVRVKVATARSAVAGILDAAQDADAILMGASEQGFMSQQWFGAVPLQLSQKSDKPLALVRNYSGLGQFVARKAWQSLYDLLPTLTSQEQIELYQRMRQASTPNINYFVLIALSAVIATLGLLLNSPAVIIGAMLVAPLMSPIVASSVGIVFGDARMLRSALTSTLQGVLLGIFIAILLTLIAPIGSPTPEVLARTQPTLLDLLVALASGMAGAYALGRKEVGEALPGVAIAAALMPPVCAIGIGFAMAAAGTAPVTIAFGAMLLFVANLAGIIVAATLVFLLLGLRAPQRAERQRSLRQGILISLVALAVVSIPLALILFESVREGALEAEAQRIVEETVQTWSENGMATVETSVTLQKIVVTGTAYIDRPVERAELAELEQELTLELDRPVELRLFVIQGQILPAEPDS